MRDRAEIVIVGAGVGGASIAWHLAELGRTDVIVIERAEPTSGSTFHSAGLVGQLRSLAVDADDDAQRRRVPPARGRVGRHRSLPGLARGRLAADRDDARAHGGAHPPARVGQDVRAADGARVGGRSTRTVPAHGSHGVLGAVWLPTDGHLDPSGLTHAFLGGAKSRGVTVETGVRVTGLTARDGRIRAVVTDHGTIDADVVVLACGMYTTEVAAFAGVNVPIVPMAHQYLITKAIDGVTPTSRSCATPTTSCTSGASRVGSSSAATSAIRRRGPARCAADFNNKLLPEDWDRFAPLFENAVTRVPAVEDVEIVQLINGPEGFTPDNEFILGESEVHGLFVAAGFCAHGIAGAGGVGRAIAEWIVDGEPSFDTWKMDIRRFGAQYRSRDYALARAVEVYSTYYDIHYPNEERQAGRPLRRSPAYERLVALGCSFGEKSSWERPNWFEPNAAHGDESLRPRGWAGEHWSPAIGVEALACRDTAALFDESSFSKMEIAGRGVVTFLDRICANDMDQPVGSVIYTQLCNERGGIECDLTATRVADDRYFVVTGTAFGNHDLGWVRKQQEALPEGDTVAIHDATAAHACFGVWGPAAR